MFRAAIAGRIPAEASVRRAVAPWHASRAHVVAPHPGQWARVPGHSDTQFARLRAPLPGCCKEAEREAS
jgi:hypothetical protein